MTATNSLTLAINPRLWREMVAISGVLDAVKWTDVAEMGEGSGTGVRAILYPGYLIKLGVVVATCVY
jgi:hypothetical protein